MTFLSDENFPAPVSEQLTRLGHDTLCPKYGTRNDFSAHGRTRKIVPGWALPGISGLGHFASSVSRISLRAEGP